MISGPTSQQFSRPEYHLADADAATVGAIIATASDIALVLDRNGVIEDFAIGAEGIEGMDLATWPGRSVEDVVTVESVGKIRDLIAGAQRGDPARWREVNHPLPGEKHDMPVRYCAVQASTDGHVILLGRDLRPVAALQRRLVNTQQSLERDYSRLLQLESRYRLLLQSATEAFLIVDSSTGRIQETNRAAATLLASEGQDITRRKFPLGLDPAGSRAMESAMASVRASGQSETRTVHAADGRTRIEALVTLFRSDDAPLFLIRLTEHAAEMPRGSGAEAQIVSLFRRASEGIVLTDPKGRIEWANDAFLELVQAAMEGQVQGEAMDRFFTRQGIDLPLILANTRETGRLRYYATSLSGLHGTASDVEVSSVALPEDGKPGYGFVFRTTGYRAAAAKGGAGALPQSAEQLTELIGRVPMKDLVRETVDVIERMCIEAALQMTDDNRASAADLLGLSRQSLYVKLRRYGLSETENGNA